MSKQSILIPDLAEIAKGVTDGYEEFDFFLHGNSHGTNGDLLGFINLKLLLCLKVPSSFSSST